jgi:hypothetical protein
MAGGWVSFLRAGKLWFLERLGVGIFEEKSNCGSFDSPPPNSAPKSKHALWGPDEENVRATFAQDDSVSWRR